MAILSTPLQSTATAISPVLATDMAVTVMMFCNLNTTIENIDIYVVAAGATAIDANKVVQQVPLDPSDTFTFSTERLVLSPGDRIYASTTTNNQVSVTVSYVTI